MTIFRKVADRFMYGKGKPRIDPEEIERKAEESLTITREQQSHVNNLTSWLAQRENQNGFGEDFEITLIPKAAS